VPAIVTGGAQSDPAAMVAEVEAMYAKDAATFCDFWGNKVDPHIRYAIPKELHDRCEERFINDNQSGAFKPNPANTPPSIRFAESRAQHALDKLNGAAHAIPQSKPIDWTALANKEPPKREWAESFWLGMGYTTGLIGPGGVGKSLTAQTWASTLSLGRSYIGEVHRARKALIWNCEDDRDEIWRRQLDISRWLGVGLEAFADSLFIESRVGHDNTMFTTEFGRTLFTPLIEELRAQAHDYQAEVVILDNAAQFYGGNENDRHQVTTFLNAISGALPGRAVILLAHPSRQAGSEYSGSSAWENAVRMRLYLGNKLPDQQQDEDPADGARYLSKRKANYTHADYRRFTFRDGVLIPDEIEGGGLIEGIRKQKAGRVVIEAARRLHELGLRMTDGSTSPQFLPKLILDYKLGEGCSKKELADAMREAMLDGALTRGVVGAYSNRSPMHGLLVK
jgi:hypothetical protein